MQHKNTFKNTISSHFSTKYPKIIVFTVQNLVVKCPSVTHFLARVSRQNCHAFRPINVTSNCPTCPLVRNSCNCCLSSTFSSKTAVFCRNASKIPKNFLQKLAMTSQPPFSSFQKLVLNFKFLSPKTQ